jgi:hypothetical protein
MGLFQNLFRRRTEQSYYEKRQRPRMDCSVSAEFTDFKGNTWSCRIINMSESGLGITTGAHLNIGNTLNIVRPSVEARVVWTSDNKAGLRIIS